MSGLLHTDVVQEVQLGTGCSCLLALTPPSSGHSDQCSIDGSRTPRNKHVTSTITGKNIYERDFHAKKSVLCHKGFLLRYLIGSYFIVSDGHKADVLFRVVNKQRPKHQNKYRGDKSWSVTKISQSWMSIKPYLIAKARHLSLMTATCCPSRLFKTRKEKKMEKHQQPPLTCHHPPGIANSASVTSIMASTLFGDKLFCPLLTGDKNKDPCLSQSPPTPYL